MSRPRIVHLDMTCLSNAVVVIEVTLRHITYVKQAAIANTGYHKELVGKPLDALYPTQ